MEAAFGLVFDVVKLPEKTRAKIIEIRNHYIANEHPAFTTNDVIERAVDSLDKILQMEKQVRDQRVAGRTPITKPQEQKNAGQTPEPTKAE